MLQIRVPLGEVARVVQDIVQGRTTWKDDTDYKKYPFMSRKSKLGYTPVKLFSLSPLSLSYTEERTER